MSKVMKINIAGKGQGLFGLTVILAIALLLLAASCGGGSLGLQDELTSNGSLAGATGNTVFVESGELPGIPSDGDGPSRSASAVETILGDSALVVSNGEVVDTTLVLTSQSGPLSGADSGLAWGLYRFSGLSGKKVTSLAVSAVPGGLDQQYSVGVSNFSEGVWEFLDTTSLPEFEYNLSQEESRLVSIGGNLYFLVVVSGGDTATVLEASAFSEDDPTGGEGMIPAMGGRPQASEGLSDRIVITWNPIDGADTYELWRAEDIDGADEVYSLVAEQAELSYADMAIELGIEYHYKVRGLNAAGTGLFGAKDSGWAGTTPPEGEDEEFGEKQVFGQIEAISAESLSVGGTVFMITENTNWVGDDNLPADMGLFTVGTMVEVHGRDNGAGGWNAARVELEDFGAGQEREVYGSIEAISEFEITVSGEPFALNAQTEWLDDNNNPIDRALFLVGSLVEVDAYTDGLGNWTAEKVKMDDGGAGTGHSELGNIEAKDASTITINGVVFSYDEFTEWLDMDNNPLTAGDFTVGMYVKAEGEDDGNGGWYAYKVKMEDVGGEGTHDELGNIQELTEFVIRVNDVEFEINGQTEWLDGDNNPITQGDFTVGELVKVEGSDNGSGGWKADKVKKEN